MGILDSLFGSKPKIDVAGSIQQQQAASKLSAQQTLDTNAIDVKNPFAALTFQREDGKVTGQTTTLNDPFQQFSTQGINAANLAAGQLPQQAFDPSGLPSGQDISQNFFNQQRALLDPVFQERNKALAISLENRGLPVEAGGGGARNFAEGPEARAQTLALQNAAFAATGMAPQEQQRQFQNALTQRALPFQEAGAAFNLGASPASLLPTGSALNQVGVQTADVLGTQKASAALEAQPSPLSSLLGAAAGLVFSPVTGGLSNTLFGAGLSGLSSMFGGGGGGRPAASTVDPRNYGASPF